MKAPFGFHLLGETFDFFSCLYYTCSSGVIEAYILLSLMIIGAYPIIQVAFPNIQIRDFFSKFTHFFKGFTFKSVGTCTFSRKIINPDQIGRRLRNIFTKIENMKKLIPD